MSASHSSSSESSWADSSSSQGSAYALDGSPSTPSTGPNPPVPSPNDGPVQSTESSEAEETSSANSDDDDVINYDRADCPSANPAARPPTGHFSALRSRKPYTSLVRTKKKKKTSSRRSKWLGELRSMTKPKFHRTTCCKKLKCFRRYDYEFYRANAHRILCAPSSQRRTILQSLLGSRKQFKFDGNPVCVAFLKRCFHFSTVLIAEVSSGKISRRPSHCSTSSSRPSSSSDNVSGSDSARSTTSNSDLTTEIKKKDAIVSFVQRIAEDCGDMMPNKTEVHLPFYQYQELFPVFDAEFKKLYPTMPPVSPRYCRRTWKQTCPQIKVMKASRFTSCDTCDQLRTALREHIISGANTSSVKDRRKKHIQFVARERMEYQKKKDRARTHSNDYLSIIIDGADQSAFGLPHFTTSTKSQRGHAMKVKLVGLLEHQVENKLSLLTMTQEHATGSNHVIEVIHRFLSRKRADGPLPPKFFVQLDNCSRENKNRYVMGYFEMLVANSVFQSVEIGFLPVGHTHEDVD